MPKRERVRERQTFAAFDDRRTSLQNRTTSRTSVALEKDRYQETTSVLSDARSGLPHPLARAVRTFQLANTSRGQYEALLDAAEILAIVMSTTAATLLPVVAHPVEAGNATFGTWTTWLGRLMDPSPARTSPVPGLQEALNGTPGNPGIVACLNTLRQERNRSAHGDKPNSREEAAMRVRESAPHLEAALDKAGFLQNLQWLLIDSFDYEERSHEFNVVARVAMGDHPDFASRPYTWHVPVSRHDVYVLSPQGPVPMSDLVASRYCPQCHQPEMCFASKVDKKHGTIHWKSFARGHGVGESGLRSEMPTQNAS
ncbi:hypothetical protein ABZ901_24450 [Actinacidiphila alni]|uniref:hypothetical protein n=1 Tax=Actinacidiphila alni TaxID=380248 RepID=UPI0033ECACE8